MRHALISIVVAGSASCIRPGDFRCSSDGVCYSGGLLGTCQAVGYCSFPDSSCVQGQRYGDQSGPYAGQCVASQSDAGVDVPDGPDSGDAPLSTPVVVTETSGATSGGAGGLGFPVYVPGLARSFLLVSVEVGSLCADPTVASVANVTYDLVPLTRITSIVGTPCDGSASRSEQWGLVNPDLGQNQLEVDLSGGAQSLYIAAVVVAGVNQATPVRAFNSASGSGTSSSVTVTSSSNDLVVNTVGQSVGITAAGQNQSIVLLDNEGSGSTLNNSGTSTAPGASSVTMTWTFNTPGDWQTISSSLEP